MSIVGGEISEERVLQEGNVARCIEAREFREKLLCMATFCCMVLLAIFVCA
jgi:hypothetical protein